MSGPIKRQLYPDHMRAIVLHGPSLIVPIWRDLCFYPRVLYTIVGQTMTRLALLTYR